MAQYKVPQDVEADDKLLGPFTFRQFVYLLIAAALVGILIFLFQLFPVLALIPLPFIALFGVLALPIKKDQPKGNTDNIGSKYFARRLPIEIPSTGIQNV